MATYKTEGLILRKRLIGETDRLYSIYTKKYGKIEAVADGSAKITSKQAGDLEPFSFSRLMIARGKSIDRVADARTISNFREGKSDWDSMVLAWSVVEGLDRLTFNGVAEAEAYDLLEELFQYIKSSAFREEKIFIQVQFFWLLFYLLGHRPLLDSSQAEFQDFINREIFFNKKNGTFFSDNLSTNSDNGFIKIPKNLFDLLKEIDKYYISNREFLHYPKVNYNLLKLFYSLVTNYYQSLTNNKINSIQLLIYGRQKR